MGHSPKATLGYGFVIMDEEGRPDSDPFFLLGDTEEESDGLTFQEFLVKIIGLKPPTKPYEQAKEEWSKYWQRKSGLEKEIGVTLIKHGSSEEPAHVLAVTESTRVTDWDSILELGQEIPTRPEWRTQLHDFCQKNEIAFREPQFLLCAYLAT
jgi:hypothetical protein